jgi:hypothetical protein
MSGAGADEGMSSRAGFGQESRRLGLHSRLRSYRPRANGPLQAHQHGDPASLNLQ